ncbi:MAG: hypothetical protein ACLQQ4_00420 [Bacteroidia bacterium]
MLTKAIDIKPDYFDAIYERACVEGDAAVSIKRLVQDNMANKGDDLKFYNDCLNDFDKIFKLNPNHAPSYFKRGIVEHWMGDTIKSCIDLKKAAVLGYDCSTAFKNFCR